MTDDRALVTVIRHLSSVVRLLVLLTGIPMLRLLGKIVLALVLLLVVAAVVVYAVSEKQLSQKFTIAAETPLVIATDSATIERGRHLFTAAAACSHCHAADASGNPVGPTNPVLNMNPPNLTRGRGGIGNSLTPAIIEHAVRHGVNFQIRRLAQQLSLGHGGIIAERSW